MSIHERFILQSIKWLQETSTLKSLTKRKSTLIQKDVPNKIHPQKLLTKNVFIDDVENLEPANKRRNILLGCTPGKIQVMRTKRVQEVSMIF